MEHKKIDVFDRLIKKYMPEPLMKELIVLSKNIKQDINEIRIREGKPIILILSTENLILPTALEITPKLINEIFDKMCEHSVYSHRDDIANGYITLEGGHRAGFCGSASMDKDKVRTCHYITSVNIRIASEHIGCAKSICNELFVSELCGVIIAGPPCCGKTTILRDIGRTLSSEPYLKKVVIVDERSEIAAASKGRICNDVGVNCDVLDKYPKGEGIMMALRTLAPDVIICDEIGGIADAKAVCEGVNAGVSVITSAHACNVNELYTRKSVEIILQTDAFSKAVILKGGHARGEVEEIISLKERKIC